MTVPSQSQDTPTPEDVAKADALARTSLVDAAALTALAAKGCTASTLFLPTLTKELAAVNIGDESSAVYRVYGVDEKSGVVRTGPKGPQTASDVLARILVENPTYGRFFTK